MGFCSLGSSFFMAGENRCTSPCCCFPRWSITFTDVWSGALWKFAANHFGTVYMADLRYLNLNLKEWLEEQGITDVLVMYQIPGFAKEKTVLRLGYK